MSNDGGAETWTWLVGEDCALAGRGGRVSPGRPFADLGFVQLPAWRDWPRSGCGGGTLTSPQTQL